MGLETATFVIDLTTTNPPASDPRGQGDDHIRLIKAALKNTFPVADRPFYFPKTEATAVTLGLDATDQNNMVQVDTSGGNVAITLPGTLGAGDKGWECEVMKITSDANAAIVSPASGTIASKCGSTATIRVGILCEPARFIWNGTSWYCSKPGTMIGSTENFDGSSVPPGYLLDDGSAFSNTAFAELFAVLGSSTLKDKRGRVEAGVDGGQNRLTTTYFGTAPVLGAAGGLETDTMALANIFEHNHPVFLNDPGHTHKYNKIIANTYMYYQAGFQGNVPDTNGDTGSATTGITIRDAAGGAGTANQTAKTGSPTPTPMKNTQPTIIVNKIKRAC